MSEASRPPRPVANAEASREEINFSHPSEREFARVLDFYGIAWRYEPTTFPLRWDDQGNILEAFSPDFYLVDTDLYVELTTLRPQLMRIKRRKIRRLKELYPEINIRLWSRSDFMRFLERLGLEDRSEELVGKEALEDQHVGS
ncbi:MAG: hypothetical protein FJZ90_06995 [Chloroflexi bacterium]|nr:hypothetical protein [Chloroflexota bacterium]